MSRAARFGIAVLAGAVAGALFLRAGGRLVMRLFAVATARAPSFSVGGTLNVIWAGAIAGSIGGVLLWAADRFLPARRWLRRVAFGALCYVIASPGFRPPQALVFALFAPVFLAYAIALEASWGRLVGKAAV